MGGIGSGGNVTAGRKPKDASLHRLQGTRSRQPVVTAAHGVVAGAEMPVGLRGEAVTVWAELAPLAVQARTLTPITARALGDLCVAIVTRDAMAAKIAEDGLTFQKISVDGAGVEHVEIKAHPLISQHRGQMQRVEAGLVRFRLSPIGKELTGPDDAPVDPFAEFEVSH